MKKSFNKSIIAVSILAAYGTAQAQDANIDPLIKPESTISVGVGGTDGSKSSRSLFGQYNGLRKDSANLLLDIDYVSRNEATGAWLTMRGLNLGLDNREFSIAYDKQGDWKVFGEYNEITRHDPRTINTALVGAGSTTPVVNLLATPGTGANLNLKTERKGLTVGIEKWLTDKLHIEASYKHEDKDGARLFGIGFTCTSGAAPGCLGPTATRTGWALLMLPEPVNSTTQQFEGKLNYSSEGLSLTAGYYGSFYSNSNGGMTPTVPGTLNNALGVPLPLNTGLQAVLSNRIALPPDNYAHQFYAQGNYAFTPTTRMTFKYSYTQMRQDDNFVGNGFLQAPAGRADLGAKVDQTLVQLGLTSRPIRNLSLVANIRYDDKDDKTPIALYNVEGTNSFTNGHLSNKKLSGKFDAHYQLPDGYRVGAGVDYEEIDRGTFTATDQVAGLSALRQKTDELGYRLEARKSMSETVTGMLSFGQSRRSGNEWLKLNGGAVTGAYPVSDAVIYNRTGIFPASLEDRDRRKVKMMADWSPVDRLSFQFVAEGGYDRYSAPTTKGLRKANFGLYGVDAAWTVTDDWKLTAYASRGDQVVKINHSTAYMADLHDLTDTFGLGVIGKPMGKLEIGGDLTYSKDVNRYNQGLDALASATNVAFLVGSGGLPDVDYRQTRIKLFAKYALERNGSLRFDLIHERNRLNEWTWGYNGIPFIYSDGTTVAINPKQNVTYLGAAYIYKWQ